MDFRILGPLEVRDRDREVRLRGGKQRALLALLLVNANRTLALDRIVDELWGEGVPETAQKMVQIYVSHLRKVLPPRMLLTHPAGYALAFEQEELDLHRFERLAEEARGALDAGRLQLAAAWFREALSLWRGPALAEFVTEPFASRERARLEELRLYALQGRLEADLLLGRHNDVVGELEVLVARYPRREGLRQQHMLALYRSGRQAESLAAYHEARRALADELGIEPSPALRELERRILQHDPSLDLAQPEPAQGSASAAAPAAAPDAPGSGRGRARDAVTEATTAPGAVRRDQLERGRESYRQRAWLETYESLSLADQRTRLAPPDLELLATAAYMLGRDEEQLDAFERAHRGYLDAGARLPAVRCAFWIGVLLMLRREIGRATGWFGRARRLLDQEQTDSVERGYLLAASGLQYIFAGDWEAAFAGAAAAADVAERFGDADLLAIALMDQGRALVRQGRMEEGLGKLDEAMVEATAGELAPIVTGLVYCGVIDGCQEVHELRRASEWTALLAEWCAGQPGLVPFTGTCLMHRAELMQLRGEWPPALEEARRAGERFAQRSNQTAAGQASYREGELLRLQGRLAEAERAYRDAHRRGYEPQPGLALLRLARGRVDAAAAAIGRAVAAATEWVERARLLPAHVEIALAAGDLERARVACDELEGIAAQNGSPMLRAQAAQARGAVELAADDGRGALPALRRARRLWQELEAPYEEAQARVLIAQASRSLGDDETASLELAAARGVFEQLGATSDVVRADSLGGAVASSNNGGLTSRELQVLRLLAAGESNKSIASELVVSKRTVDRHVSNIFTKIRVTSRAAATAYAYEHELV
jgi:DNA-binding SARP family transcriptional activator/DNA-binding CsgD family transcriptional regulator